MQRPFFSQSPNRVGSGPVGPPSSPLGISSLNARSSRGRGEAVGSLAGSVAAAGSDGVRAVCGVGTDADADVLTRVGTDAESEVAAFFG
jgi:hypothetical protein